MNLSIQNKSLIAPIRHALVLTTIILSFAGRSAWAVCQDGCLTDENTVQGDDALIGLTTGFGNTAVGFNALFSNATGNFNTAVGAEALANNTAAGNTAVGFSALTSNTSGLSNTATGWSALSANTIGTSNTAMGTFTLTSNTTGTDNTAIGAGALGANTTGVFNTAVGRDALNDNTTGGAHTAVGYHALISNTTGAGNTATGTDALASNTTGGLNVANGNSALANNTTASLSTAVGSNALQVNTTGFNNTAIGASALQLNDTSSNNTAVGHFALQNNTGASNTALGDSAGINLTNGSNNIDIGSPGLAGDNNTIRIGTVGTQTGTFIAGIRGAVVSGGIAVFVKANGKLGTNTSSRRFKDEIKPMDKASEAILALNPVSFRYKADLDPDGVPQFGLIAEEVEKVHPDLVVRDEKGEVYSVRYEAVNAMLLNEFLKEHRKVEQQDRQLQKQAATIARQQKDIDTLKAGLQKVNDKLELNNPAPRLVENDK
jgi:hypothetical protein